MCSPLLPQTTSIRHAAILAGCSIDGFTEHVLPRCATEDGRVDTAALERELGYEITCAAWMAADRRLDQRRAQQAAHKRSAHEQSPT